ncbi:hypothetical protein TRVL_00608 [Trypanosoma vivax]|nr:hypothetical protein TRVL_00608 [Trypanosoma vivax]
MQLYFLSNVANRGIVEAELLASHPTLPLIASVWMNPYHLLITDSEGDTVDTFTPKDAPKNAQQSDGNSKADSITCIAWHPTQPILAIGWQSGSLSLWLTSYGKPKEVVVPTTPPVEVEKALSQHADGAVVTCVWSGSGNSVLTSSKNLRAAMWALESSTASSENGGRSGDAKVVRHTLTAQWSVPTTEVVTLALSVSPLASVCGANNQRAAPVRERRASRALMIDEDDHDNSFFVACNTDKRVYVLSEEQKLAPLSTLDDPPVNILYDPVERLFVILTAAHFIVVFRVSPSLTTELLLRRKLSTPLSSATTERFTQSMHWAAPGVLAFCCGDDRVRFFDIQSDRMYMVPYPSGTAVHITDIATLENKGLLVMSTAEGSVAVFKRPSNFRPSASPLRSVYGAGGPEGGFRGRSSSTTGRRMTQDGSANDSSLVDPGSQWDLLTTIGVDGRVERVCLFSNNHIVLTLSSGKMQLLRETVRKRAWDGVAAATQVSMDIVVVESITGCQCLLKSSSKIYGLSIAFPFIGLWSGQQIDLYTVNESTSTASLTTFITTTSPAFAIHLEGIFYVKDANRVVFANFQLVTVAQLAFTESEGSPTIVDVMGDMVVALSSGNAMRLARVVNRELRMLGPPRQLPPLGESLVVSSAKVNAQGRRVALMARHVETDQLDTRIWVYDADTDNISSYDFMLRGEVPHAVYWNTPEPNSNTIGELGYLLLACETHQVKKNDLQLQFQWSPDAEETAGDDEGEPREDSESPSTRPSADAAVASALSFGEDKSLGDVAMPDLENFAEKNCQEDNADCLSGISGVNPLANRSHHLVTLFATNKGIVVHNTVELKRYHICLVGLTIPDFLLTSVRFNGNPGKPEDYMIEQKRLRDFEGLKTEKDAAVLEALMKFSYYSAIGNMDEAYRCVQTIKSPAVWQNLAKMCVYSGRLDVASVCLAQMQDGVAACALRVARTAYPGEKDVHLATLACSLGLVRECESLLRKAKRYDLITDLLLACGKFDQAQRHACKFDRVRVYPVAYKYAQFMESFSNFDAAVMWYHNAKCFGTDVVRMYFQNGRLAELRHLVIPSSKKIDGDEVNAEATCSASGGKDGRDSGTKDNGDGIGKRRNSDDLSDTLSAISLRSELEPEAVISVEDEHSKEEKVNDSERVRASLERLFMHNPELLVWWAKHSERRKKFSDALKFYTLARDTYNIVRLMCADTPPQIEEAVGIVDGEISKSIEQANAIATRSGATASSSTPEPVGAAFFVGKHYDSAGDVSRALKYYEAAGAWRSAAKLAKSRQMVDELFVIAQKSEDVQLMHDCAIYLELQNAHSKAVELYHAVGDIQKAIQVCIKGGLYDTMHRISSTLDAESDSEVFLQMASHFIDSGHHTKAAEMYVFAKQFTSALNLCVENGVALTDEMAEAITADASCRNMTPEQRNELERQIASIARDQGNWNLACKKYTQIGERVKAMKMLMRGGDVKKVIFFANHSRSIEIYTLAGNFLQSQNWHTDSNIHKHIILFYTRSKAFSNLVSYVGNYAQLQIDENRNYYEAWRVIDECIGQLEHNHAASNHDSSFMGKLEGLRSRRDVIALVVKALKLLSDTAKDEAKANEFISVCSDLIMRSRPNHQDHAEITSAIRIGDIFALLVRHYQENMNSPKEALRVIEGMIKHNVEPQFFVERELLETVCKSNGRKVAEFIGDGLAGGSGKEADDGNGDGEVF